MVSSCRVIYFIFFWSLMILGSTDGGSVTWYEPLPVETTSDHNIELTADSRQLLKGSTHVQLSWNFTLTPDLSLITVALNLKSVTVAIAVPSSGVAGVQAGFEARFNFTWISQRATLIIFSVSEDDDGEFDCELSTVQGVQNKVWKRKMKVEVLVPASLTHVSADQIVREGLNMQLLCEATGNPEPNITWTRLLENGSYSGVLHQGPTQNFSNINRTDAGTYCCTASNGFGNPVSHKVKVNVTYPAKVLNVSASKPVVEVQESVSLCCTAEGNPEPTYSWMPCDQQNVCHESKLDVSGVRSDDDYICTVSNSLGTNSGNVSVSIGGELINITMVITSESCTNGNYNQSSLWIRLNETFDKVFANKSTYNSSQLTDVRCGSVTTDVRLKFNSIIRETVVIDTLQSAVRNGMLGEFKVNVSSIKGTRPVIEKSTQVATTSPSSPSDSKTWIIVGAVLGSLALLGVAGVVAWFVYRKRKCKKRDTKVHNNGSRGEEGENVQGEGYVEVNKGYEDRANRRPGVPPAVYDTAQTGKRGAAKGQPVAEYAVVDKSKKKPRKPKPGELQYAELGEFSTGQGGQRSSLSPTNRHTETQYADVNAM